MPKRQTIVRRRRGSVRCRHVDHNRPTFDLPAASRSTEHANRPNERDADHNGDEPDGDDGDQPENRDDHDEDNQNLEGPEKAGIDGMTAPKEIKGLVKRFHENRDVYCSSAYNETQARHEFIDPFFNALGWQPLPT